MSKNFRHRESHCATTRNVQGGREHGCASELNKEADTNATNEQPNKAKGKSNGQKICGTPNTETPNHKRIEPTNRRYIREEKNSNQPAIPTTADPSHLRKM